jgi:hypothetical protein
MGITTIPCVDASLSREQVYRYLQLSGKKLSMNMPDQPLFSPTTEAWFELIFGDSKSLDQNLKDALWKFDEEYHTQSDILLHALFMMW